ncbi:MAG: hypothetical protein IPJ79_08865 [Bacteroidetes bacterium]|nr:hypothetical protein [Bacteroidota bacterium]
MPSGPLAPGVYQIVPSNMVQIDTVPNYAPVIYENGVLTVSGAPNVTATVGTIECNGGSTTVVVSATGGTAPYTGEGTFIVPAGLIFLYCI